MLLYSFAFAPNPLKVRLALLELGVEFQSVEVDLWAGAHRTEEFAKLNPMRKVPVLDDDGFLLRESSAILAYLGGKYPSPLWPQDAAGQALALQWLFFEAEHMSRQSSMLWWADHVAPRIQRPAADVVVLADAQRELGRALDHLEQHLGSAPFVLGQEFGLVDCCFAASLAALRSTRMDDGERWPRIIEYRERLRARPSWIAAHGDAIHDLA